MKQVIVGRSCTDYKCFSYILEEKTEDFPSQMLPPGLLVVHDTSGRGQDDKPELSAGQQVVGPLFNLVDGHIKPRGDDPTLVESSCQIDDNLAGSVIVNNFKLPDVTVLHHDGQEPHDDLNELGGVDSVVPNVITQTDLGAGPDEDLPLASLLSIVNAPKCVGK